MSDARNKITVSIDSRRYEDSDTCLTDAARDYIASHPELRGWDLSPRWGDESRATILLSVPVEAERSTLKAAMLECGLTEIDDDDDTAGGLVARADSMHHARLAAEKLRRRYDVSTSPDCDGSHAWVYAVAKEARQ